MGWDDQGKRSPSFHGVTNRPFKASSCSHSRVMVPVVYLSPFLLEVHSVPHDSCPNQAPPSQPPCRLGSLPFPLIPTPPILSSHQPLLLKTKQPLYHSPIIPCQCQRHSMFSHVLPLSRTNQIPPSYQPLGSYFFFSIFLSSLGSVVVISLSPMVMAVVCFFLVVLVVSGTVPQ